MKKILIIYYSQTGQLKDIADSIVSGLNDEADIHVDFFKINPVKDFPFPWPSDEFFDSMPESVKGIPVEIDMDGFPSEVHYDLVILAYQVWYLSPSIPFFSLLQKDEVKRFLHGKNVLTLLGVRNMWVVAQQKIRKLLFELKSNLVGNIVLTDRVHNLISVITIIQWLIRGNKGSYRFLPNAGVSGKDIKHAVKFAAPIKQAILEDNFSELQSRLIELQAVHINYHTMQIEKTAIRIFHKFAAFILKKGDAGNKHRIFRVRLFKYYLLFVIFVVFPFAALVFDIKKVLTPVQSVKEIDYHKGIIFR